MRLDRDKVYLQMAKLRINQKELADRAGISRQTVSAVINGRRCRPDLLGKIASALKTEPENIIE